VKETSFIVSYEQCRLCPRNCRVNRTTGPYGYCRQSADCRIASLLAHFGEEPPLSGTKGSGTIFFSGCSSRCFFCQNYQISQEDTGHDITPEELLSQTFTLIESGVHNLNFVTPDHFWPHIANLCRQLRDAGVTIPFIFNCSGYEQPEMVPEYAQWMDIFLPDFKFADPELAAICMHDRRYPTLALASIKKMVNEKGFLKPFDTAGQETARQGVLVRHLVLPKQVENSLEVLRLLHREFGPELPLSVMSQYQPVPACMRLNQLTDPLSKSEYTQVCNLVEELGFENAFIQPEFGDKAFFPDFSKDAPFAGNRR